MSELATNALLHGVPAGRGYLLRLLRLEHLVRAEVHDSGGGRGGGRGRGPRGARGRRARALGRAP
ncbi:signal transduction histidine kinase, partial [Streptomyces vinaceus]